MSATLHAGLVTKKNFFLTKNFTASAARAFVARVVKMSVFFSRKILFFKKKLFYKYDSLARGCHKTFSGKKILFVK